ASFRILHDLALSAPDRGDVPRETPAQILDIAFLPLVFPGGIGGEVGPEFERHSGGKRRAGLFDPDHEIDIGIAEQIRHRVTHIRQAGAVATERAPIDVDVGEFVSSPRFGFRRRTRPVAAFDEPARGLARDVQFVGDFAVRESLSGQFVRALDEVVDVFHGQWLRPGWYRCPASTFLLVGCARSFHSLAHHSSQKPGLKRPLAHSFGVRSRYNYSPCYHSASATATSLPNRLRSSFAPYGRSLRC